MVHDTEDEDTGTDHVEPAEIRVGSSIFIYAAAGPSGELVPIGVVPVASVHMTLEAWRDGDAAEIWDDLVDELCKRLKGEAVWGRVEAALEL